MYITKKDFEKIDWAINFLISEISDYRLKDSHAGTKSRCFEAYSVLRNLEKKKAKDTARQVAYINGKRKTDPKYFRSRKKLEKVARDIIDHDMEICLEYTEKEIEEHLKSATDNDLIEFIKSYD